ncbi:MAG: hypothetical protein AB1921_01850 [Thermodesulfobacteriota bacterium]
MASSKTKKDARIKSPSHSDANLLDKLRILAKTNPARASDETWDWFTEFQSLDAHGHLPWLFSQGTAPESPRGDCEGMVLGLYGNSFLTLVDRLVRLGRVLGGIGWTGKTFDPDTGTGYNRLTPSSRVPMFLTMPWYGFKKIGGELIGFQFDHLIEPSPLLPGQEVRAIAYANPKYKNPLVLPSTRDEIVEIIPNVYLGRVLLSGASRWRIVGYFALRQPVKKGS